MKKERLEVIQRVFRGELNINRDQSVNREGFRRLIVSSWLMTTMVLLAISAILRSWMDWRDD
jgi:hypothetical protein